MRTGAHALRPLARLSPGPCLPGLLPGAVFRRFG